VETTGAAPKWSTVGVVVLNGMLEESADKTALEQGVVQSMGGVTVT